MILFHFSFQVTAAYCRWLNIGFHRVDLKVSVKYVVLCFRVFVSCAAGIVMT